MAERMILVVDDSADDRDLTIHALKQNKVSYQVHTAVDGVEALDLLLGRGGRERLEPMLVVMDLNMPRVDGLQALRALRLDRRTWLLPVIMLTASQEEQDRLRSYDLGVNTFIRKPVDSPKFNEAVRLLGLYRLLADGTLPLDLK